MTVNLKILDGKYPAKAHAKKVKDWIIENGGDGSGVVYLEGQKKKYNEVKFTVISALIRSELYSDSTVQDNDQESCFRYV
jgi:hypothetical protein